MLGEKKCNFGIDETLLNKEHVDVMAIIMK